MKFRVGVEGSMEFLVSMSLSPGLVNVGMAPYPLDTSAKFFSQDG
jgi:hypothetical protein